MFGGRAIKMKEKFYNIKRYRNVGQKLLVFVG